MAEPAPALSPRCPRAVPALSPALVPALLLALGWIAGCALAVYIVFC